MDYHYSVMGFAKSLATNANSSSDFSVSSVI